MDKMDGKTMDIVAENVGKLKGLFPAAFTEGKVDFEALKEVLGTFVDDRDERYSFTWNGKSKARMIAQTPSTGTLRPCKEESVDWDTTKNIFIEGDNLEVLKLLQKSYHKKVKMIYIDPPYNTGKDFVYKDNFKDNIKNYKEITGQVDGEGRNLTNNPETSGRYHTDWLNMMYPRLKLARNLLSEHGIIFISINENELSNLRSICFEIFGEENHCSDFIWNTEGNTDNQYKVKVNHEYILAMYKNAFYSDRSIGHVIDPNTREDSNLWKGIVDNNINKNNPANPPSIIELPTGFPCSQEQLQYKAKCVDDAFFEETARDKYITDSIKERYDIENLSGLPVKLDDMIIESGKLTKPCRIYVGMANRNKLEEFISNDCKPIKDGDEDMSFYINANAAVRYNKKNNNPRNILSVLRNMGTTERTKTYLRNMGVPYDYPKPVDLMKYLIRLGCEDKQGIIFDFFAGSGTMGEAVSRLNSEDGGNRKYILAQLPENCEQKSEALKAGFEKLTEVGKERIRRAAAKIKEENPEYDGDLGFKVFKLDSTNIKPWEVDFDLTERTLEDYISNIKSDRREEDVLYEILLKYGLDLTLPISERSIAGQKVFDIGMGALIICLADAISLEVVEGMAKLKEELNPEIMRVVFKDSGFADDVVKTNAVQILKQAGIVDVRSL
jgi:adenine-specific DNA-methyltransferase